MKLKTLRIDKNLEESIPTNGTYAIPEICTDNFDDYVGREWPCHWHGETEIGIVTDGIVEFTIYGEDERRTVRLKKGDGIYIAGGCLHGAAGILPSSIITEAVFSAEPFNGSAFGIVFNRYLQTLFSSGVKYLVFEKDAAKDEQILSAIKEICADTGDSTEISLHKIETLCKICRLLLERTRQSGSVKPFINTAVDIQVKEILSYIHAHFSERITIEDLSKSACISRTRCFNIFKDVLGQSPIEYLTQYRMSHACSLLTGSDYTVNEIAALCGYKTTSFFGKVFKSKYGVTPDTYRNRDNQKKRAESLYNR